MKKSQPQKRSARRPAAPPASQATDARGGRLWIAGILAATLALAIAVVWRREAPVAPPPQPSVANVKPPTVNPPGPAAAIFTAIANQETDGGELDAAELLIGPRDDMGENLVAALPASNQKQYQLAWDGLKEDQRLAGLLGAMESNIRHQDYAGPESCKECHADNYEKWSHHSHRWMNAEANDQTVVGDFSDGPPMNYLGGTVRFHQQDGQRLMSLQRGDVQRTYNVTRTIGSRFTQYYVGYLQTGPEPDDHVSRRVEQVLPIGWWIDRKEWVPVVHIDTEGPDGTRWDAFADVSDIAYDGSCAACHTTPAMGDWMINPNGILRVGYYSHVPVSFDVKGYLRETQADYAAQVFDGPATTKDERKAVVAHIRDQHMPTHAVNLGISCEACHHGSEEHVRASDRNKSAVLPHFFPVSSNVVTSAPTPASVYARNPQSVNFVCARCHTGKRPYFAGGMATWNSVEYSDAEAGYCYLRKNNSHPELEILSCIQCHDPHEATGARWAKTPDEDDASCLKCHQKYEPATERFRHTRHAGGSAGARCFNCHMPRVNEGMQDIVRTHAISNPTWPSMIEANQPNACNLCHLDQSIDWTIRWLSRWYRIDRYKSYDDELLAKNYPDRSGPVGLGWLKSTHEPTRMVALDALAREKSHWALPEMIAALDDDYLLNRQFARIGLEQWLGVRLEDYGYRFYMTREERKQPLVAVRKALLRDP